MGQVPTQLCAYCGERLLTGDERLEHPIPAALGSSLAVATVCDSCNAWASRHVDQPFLDDDWVRIYRARHQITDPRHSGGVPVHPLRRGRTDDGQYVSIDEAGKPRLASRIIERDDGTAVVQAPSMEEAERLIERLRRRWAKEGMRPEIVRTEIRRVRPLVHVDVSSNMRVWTRMGAKIALAVAAHAYGGSWCASGDAGRLRRLMLDGEDEEERVLIPEPTEDDHVLRLFADPPEHLICFLPGQPTKLAVLLFGSLLVAEVVDSQGLRTPSAAWLLDPRRPRASGRTTWDELMWRAVGRAA